MCSHSRVRVPLRAFLFLSRFFSLAMEPKTQYPILLGESIKEEDKQKLLLRCLFWMRA